MLPTLSSLCYLVHTVPALAFKAAKPDMAQKIVSGLHFRSRSLYGPGVLLTVVSRRRRRRAVRIAAAEAAGVASKATAAMRAARFVHRAAQPCIFTANAKPPAS